MITTLSLLSNLSSDLYSLLIPRRLLSVVVRRRKRNTSRLYGHLRLTDAIHNREETRHEIPVPLLLRS